MSIYKTSMVALEILSPTLVLTTVICKKSVRVPSLDKISTHLIIAISKSRVIFKYLLTMPLLTIPILKYLVKMSILTTEISKSLETKPLVVTAIVKSLVKMPILTTVMYKSLARHQTAVFFLTLLTAELHRNKSSMS
uniref:Uncharacterized protein n=1 Tax=Cacopsylla melanoneura TaxID=428564 RepID=A0A8D8S2G1_9HEMI